LLHIVAGAPYDKWTIVVKILRGLIKNSEGKNHFIRHLVPLPSILQQPILLVNCNITAASKNNSKLPPPARSKGPKNIAMMKLKI
jgi:hypothetical protein